MIISKPGHLPFQCTLYFSGNNVIYDYTVYEEKVQKNIARSKKYWNISITLAILFLINSLLGILSLGIILAVGMVGSYFISIINSYHNNGYIWFNNDLFSFQYLGRI